MWVSSSAWLQRCRERRPHCDCVSLQDEACRAPRCCGHRGGAGHPRQVPPRCPVSVPVVPSRLARRPLLHAAPRAPTIMMLLFTMRSWSNLEPAGAWNTTKVTLTTKSGTLTPGACRAACCERASCACSRVWCVTISVSRAACGASRRDGDAHADRCGALQLPRGPLQAHDVGARRGREWTRSAHAFVSVGMVLTFVMCLRLCLCLCPCPCLCLGGRVCRVVQNAVFVQDFQYFQCHSYPPVCDPCQPLYLAYDNCTAPTAFTLTMPYTLPAAKASVRARDCLSPFSRLAACASDRRACCCRFVVVVFAIVAIGTVIIIVIGVGVVVVATIFFVTVSTRALAATCEPSCVLMCNGAPPSRAG
jgi:hypothetical protein